MTIIHYNYSDTELKNILDSMIIIVDTREQKNQHVLDYLRKKNVSIKFKGMKTGDYSAMIPKNEDYGITRDMYLSAAIERKNGVDELVQSIKDRSRFENELIRASKYPFTLLVEDLEGYQKILNGKYRSQYKPQSLLGSLKTFEVRYNFSTVFINPSATGNYIYHHFHYMARELLKGGPCVNELMKALYCERKKDELKARLLKMGYFKTPDGRQLYELSLAELDEIFKKKLIERGK